MAAWNLVGLIWMCTQKHTASTSACYYQSLTVSKTSDVSCGQRVYYWKHHVSNITTAVNNGAVQTQVCDVCFMINSNPAQHT